MSAMSKDHSASVLAEKLEAIVALSLLTSRMKNFYDLYIIISRTFTLGYEDVLKAVRTAQNRFSSTVLPLTRSRQG